MIQTESRKDSKEIGEIQVTQFIASTFRPELVNAAHKCYGVTMVGKESSINPISKEEALRVIQEEQDTNKD